jgi:hypothetical protein
LAADIRVRVRRAVLVLSIALVALPAPAALAKEPGVTTDDPAGKEYALPLNSVRHDSNSGHKGGGGGGAATTGTATSQPSTSSSQSQPSSSPQSNGLFGAGIKPDVTSGAHQRGEAQSPGSSKLRDLGPIPAVKVADTDSSSTLLTTGAIVLVMLGAGLGGGLLARRLGR